jgi:Protein of unknown function (DUF3176)
MAASVQEDVGQPWNSHSSLDISQPDSGMEEITEEINEIPQQNRISSTTSSVKEASSSVSPILLKESLKEQEILEYRRSLRQELWAWRLELFALFAFISAIGAIVGTVYPYKGKPSPQLPFRITVNTLLSVYATIIKAAIASVAASVIYQAQWTWFATERRPIYDVAQYQKAGGLLGAITWLWSYHVRQPLVTLGAIIIILAVAIDPFIQQMIHFSDCYIPEIGGVASLPRTSYVSTKDFTNEMQAAFIGGLFNSTTAIDFSCSTGNCTFETLYNTIGFCHKCTDITNDLTSVPGPIQAANLTGVIYVLPSVNLTYSLPSGLSISQYNFYNMMYGMILAEAPKHEWWSPTVEIITLPFWQPGINLETNQPIPGCDNPANENSWHCTGLGAMSCSLSPCVQTYNATVENGKLNETLVETNDIDLGWGDTQSINETYGLDILGLIDSHCLSSSDRQALMTVNLTQQLNNKTTGVQQGNITWDSSIRWIPYMPPFNLSVDLNGNYSSETPFPESLIAHGCLYMFNADLATQLDWNIIEILTGNITYALDTYTTQSGESVADLTINGPLSLQQIYNNTHADFNSIDMLFESVAKSLTSVVRRRGENSQNFGAPALGLTKRYSVCLQVQWTWIAYPATLATLTILLLVIAIIFNARAQAPLWKSSPLIFFFHGEDGETWFNDAGPVPITKYGKQSINTTSTMEQLSQSIYVQLDVSNPLMKLRRINVSGYEDKESDDEFDIEHHEQHGLLT